MHRLRLKKNNISRHVCAQVWQSLSRNLFFLIAQTDLRLVDAPRLLLLLLWLSGQAFSEQSKEKAVGPRLGRLGSFITLARTTSDLDTRPSGNSCVSGFSVNHDDASSPIGDKRRGADRLGWRLFTVRLGLLN